MDLYEMFTQSLKKECINNKPVQKVVSINTFNIFNFNYNATLYTIGMNDWKTIKVFELEEEKEITEFSNEYSFRNIAFNSSKSIVAIAYDDNSINVCDIYLKEKIVFRGHEEYIFSLVFNEAGTILASGSYDKIIKLWSIESHTEITTLKGH